MKTYFVILMTVIGLTVFKADKNRNISGTVLSAFDNTPLAGASIKIIGAATQTNTDGNGQYHIIVPAGKTQVVFSFIGYKSDTINLLKSNVIDVHLVKHMLYTFKEDTVNYKASAYKVREKASTDELLKHMEGMEVNADGSVTHQGQAINKVRINGRDYAGGDVQAVTKKLPADVLNSIQVIDDYGDQAAMTGVKSGDPNKVLNITIRGNTPLSNNLSQLNEVAVVAYGTQKKANVTNPSNQITAQYLPPRIVVNSPGTESYGRIVENQFEDPKTTPLSTFAVDVDAASYANVRRFINAGQLPPKNAVRIEEMVNYFHYDLPVPTNGEPVAIQTEMSAAPWNPQHELVRIGLKAKEVKLDKLPPSNLVFLLDVSGSMGDPNKLSLVKTSMKMLVDQLRPIDNVAIVVYAGEAGLKLPSTTGNEKQKIKDAIDQLYASGSTAGGAGLRMAYQIARNKFIKGGNNRIILATDGDFNVGPASDKDMEQLIEDERDSKVSIFILGFGMGNLKDSKMERMADKGHGNYAYIDNITEATKSMVNEFGGTLFTVAKDVKVQVEFNPGKVQAYRLLGYEDRLLAKEDFNNDSKVAGDMGVGHTVTALYEIIPVGVKDNFAGSVDPLKYQKPTENKTVYNLSEIMTVKFRYKEPDADVSKMESVTVSNKTNKTSDDFRFAAAVVEYGMLLRDSKFKQNANFDQLISMAKSGKGKDDDGYRAEFIRLAESTKNIMKAADQTGTK